MWSTRSFEDIAYQKKKPLSSNMHEQFRTQKKWTVFIRLAHGFIFCSNQSFLKPVQTIFFSYLPVMFPVRDSHCMPWDLITTEKREACACYLRRLWILHIHIITTNIKRKGPNMLSWWNPHITVNVFGSKPLVWAACFRWVSYDFSKHWITSITARLGFCTKNTENHVVEDIRSRLKSTHKPITISLCSSLSKM